MNSAIVLVLLAVIWAAVLIPPWLQGRREDRPTATIRSFHRQLFLLGQAAPEAGPAGLEAPARFQRSTAPRSTGPRGAGPRRADPRRAARFVGDDRGRVLLHDERRDGAAPRRRFGAGEDLGYGRYGDHVGQAYDGAAYGGYADDLDRYDDAVARHSGYGPGEAYDLEDLGYDPREAEAREAAVLAATYGLTAASARRWAQRVPRHPAANGVGRVGARPGVARRRAGAYRRRRRVLAVLAASVAITLVWAFVLQVTAAWVIHAVADLLLVSYLGLLARRGRRAAEQADKVRYLAPIEAPRPAVVVLHGGAAR